MNPITDVAQAFLDGVLDAIDDPPTRYYLSMNEPAYDCEQVVVWWSGLRPSDGNNVTKFGPVKCNLGNAVDFSLAIVRCDATMGEDGGEPSAARLTADAVMFADDAWALWTVVYPQLASRSLFAGIPEAASPAADLSINTIIPETGEGGVAALRWSISLQFAPVG